MTSSDFSGVEICFLLEITWDSRIYRFASFPVELVEGNESYSYIGGLDTPEFEQQSNRADLDPLKLE